MTVIPRPESSQDREELALMQRNRTWSVLLLTQLAGLLAAPSFAGSATWPGERSTWHGYPRYDFEVDGRPVLVVAPHKPALGKPWVWHGEFFGHVPEPELALLGRGFHIVYMSIPDQFGSPTAVNHWNAFYDELTGTHGLARRAALIGISRGGLYCYNWASQNPEKVACIYGDAPVCDVRSWPAGNGKGTGNSVELKRILEVYGVTDEEDLFAVALNPIDNLQPLAEAGVPLLHVYGDADTGVPWDENTGVLAERYVRLGGEVSLIAKPGVGHVHGLEDSTPIVEFIAAHAFKPNSGAEQPIDIGSRRELFVDRHLIARATDVRLQLHEPRDEGSVLTFDRPYEGPGAGYSTVIKDGDEFRLYYRGISERDPDGEKPKYTDGSRNERACLALSEDGVAWTKPDLGLFEFEGNNRNNIVLADAAPATHNFCPMIDARPGVDPEERYKAVGGTGKELFAFISADGIHWRSLQEEAILSSEDMPFPHLHLFDSQNVVFWSDLEQCYLCYFRVWDGLRRVARTTSQDFRTWTPAVMMQHVHDDGESGPQPAPVEQLYTNQTFPYFRAPHIYVATAARFFEGRQVLTEQEAKAINVLPGFSSDTSDSVFMTSRGGDIYDRTFLEGYIKPGIGAENWVSRTNYPALNVVQTGPHGMSLYVNHDYAQPTAHLRRYSMRLDGFASLRAGARRGEFVTKPIVFSGDQLTLNFATSAGGVVQIELQDAAGQPLPGFSLADCRELIGNEIARIVTWQSGRDVSDLAGQSVRLRIQLKDADLYSFQFTSQD